MSTRDEFRSEPSSPVDELLAMSPDEHLRAAAETATRSCNRADLGTHHLAVQTSLLWAIAKQGQQRQDGR